MADGSQSAKVPRRRGRPTVWEWSEELMQDICDHLTTGKSLIEIAALQGYPSSDSLYRQMARDPNFAERIARAREAGQDHEADWCVRMADMATAEDVNVVKLRIWARQWRASKLAPKRYGDKVAHTGADGGPIQVASQFDVRLFSDEDREMIREAIARAKARQLEGPGVIDGEFSEVEE